jgi:nucleotide-binding universal stress UspA family protein
MTHPANNPGAPRKVLLATDLSARGDRALERAIANTRRHDAELLIVHAFEDFQESTITSGRSAGPSWRRPPDAVAIMKRRILQGLRADLGDAVERASIRVEEGDPAEVVERIAMTEQVDLVVTGVAREALFARQPVILGRTVEQLLRRLPVPVLIVRNRVRSDYEKIVVTTDFSGPSGYALQLALRFFSTETVHLLHVSEAPYTALASDANRHAESFLDIHAADLEDFLASIFLPAEDRKRIVSMVEPGSPRQLVREFAQLHGVDLVVLGTHGRGAVLEALFGSGAKSILSTLPCDALVVRGPGQ